MASPIAPSAIRLVASLGWLGGEYWRSHLPEINRKAGPAPSIAGSRWNRRSNQHRRDGPPLDGHGRL
jgi:hypothetical protein